LDPDAKVLKDLQKMEFPEGEAKLANKIED
jgi:hypothetical protein